MPSGNVHELEVGDDSHPVDHMEEQGHVQQMETVQMVEEEQMVQMEVPQDAGAVPNQIQLTPEQLATLSTGDYIEIDGQMYKIEFAPGEGQEQPVEGETEVVETAEEEIVG